MDPLSPPAASLSAPAQSFLALAVIGALGLPFALPSRGVRRPARAWALLAFFGLSDAANFALDFGALSRGSATVAVLTHYLAPVGWRSSRRSSSMSRSGGAIATGGTGSLLPLGGKVPAPGGRWW